MSGNTKSKLDIINMARRRAGMNPAFELEDNDEDEYDAEREIMLKEYTLPFSEKDAPISQLGLDEDDYFIKPKDYLDIIYPAVLDAKEDKLKIEGDEMRYIVNVTETELFDPSFVDALAYGLAARFAQVRRDYQALPILLQLRDRVLTKYARRTITENVMDSIKY